MDYTREVIFSTAVDYKVLSSAPSRLKIVARQVAPLEEARAHLNDFAASEGEDLEHLDKAYDCSIKALSATNSSSLDALFAASIIAVSTGYTKDAKVLSSPPSNALSSELDTPRLWWTA